MNDNGGAKILILMTKFSNFNQTSHKAALCEGNFFN